MPTNLALIDLISPYVLRSTDIGTWRPILAILFVDHCDTVADESGVVLEGVAHFSSDSLPFFDPKNAVLGSTPLADKPSSTPKATEAVHPKDDPERRDPWFDLRDTSVDFRLVAPRTASQKVATGLAGAAGDAFAPTAAVLAAWDAAPSDAPPSDYPNTAFTLDLLLTAAVLRPPFLHGARMDVDGALVPDPDHDRVSLTLPRLKLRLTQGSNPADPLSLDLISAGASGLDDPADRSVAELITMDPPYAFIGTSQVVGFGFRSALLDLSEGVTPPTILERFGFDESWKGVYLPEVRLFVAPHGMRGLALDAGAKDLLIGVGDHSGVSGDFDLEVIQQGTGPAKVSARFLAADGQSYGTTETDDKHAIALVPPQTTMVIDLVGGREPQVVTVSFGTETATTPGRVHSLSLLDAPQGRGPSVNIFIKVAQPGSPQTVTDFVITAIRKPEPAALTPGPDAPALPAPPATVTTTSVVGEGSTPTSPSLVIEQQTDTAVVLSLQPPDVKTVWTVPGEGDPSDPSVSTSVSLAPGETKPIIAIRPAYEGGDKLVCYFQADHPFPDEDSSGSGAGGYSDNPANTHTTPAVAGDQAAGWEPAGHAVLVAYAPVLERVPAGKTLTVVGFDDQGDNSEVGAAYPESLALRRAQGFAALVQRAYPEKNFHFTTSGQADPSPVEGRPSRSWRAELTVPLVALPGPTVGTTTTGT
ncbi:MAG TPA: hypothetical protein VEX66_18395, partial [Microlunatus sp.]|nr:hypothetical protein [Microlunatus sp.]